MFNYFLKKESEQTQKHEIKQNKKEEKQKVTYCLSSVFPTPEIQAIAYEALRK